MVYMRPWLALPALLIALAGCSSSTPSPPAAPPQVTLPANQPPLKCADLEPPPVRLDPMPKVVGRQCTDADGSVRWGAAIYKCADGSVWPVLSNDQAARPAEPTGAAFDKCVGRA